jgi:hypothetical protein
MDVGARLSVAGIAARGSALTCFIATVASWCRQLAGGHLMVKLKRWGWAAVVAMSSVGLGCGGGVANVDQELT